MDENPFALPPEPDPNRVPQPSVSNDPGQSRISAFLNEPGNRIAPRTQSDAAPQEAVDKLRGAQGWARFLSIMLFIGGGFLSLGILGVLASLGTAGRSAPPIDAIAVLSMFAITIFGCFVPAVLLGAYASSISRVYLKPLNSNFEVALEKQRGLFKYAAISGIFLVLLNVIQLAVNA